MPHGWEGEKVRLVPLDRARHLDNALVWMNDPTITEWLLVGDFPLGRLAEEQFFDQAERGQPDTIAFAVETLAGEHLGFCGLHRIDYRHGTAVTGTVLGRRDLWGQGLGTDVARVRARYAFDVLGLRLLLSEVLSGNEASARMLRRVGYTEVGKIPRRYFKRGAYRDAHQFALERDDWHRNVGHAQ